MSVSNGGIILGLHFGKIIYNIMFSYFNLKALNNELDLMEPF